MIDNTLARMIDEILRRSRDSYVFGRSKMLEVRANRAHLVELRVLLACPSNLRDFVRDLFTIKCFALVPERC